MRVAVGDAIPEATVYVMGEAGPESRISTDLFAGRKSFCLLCRVLSPRRARQSICRDLLKQRQTLKKKG